jgi:putative tributyrin esterase
MPNAYITYYRDPIDRRGMESAIIEELIPMIDATFATDARREARFISGLSMGGYGALYLGVKYPHLFSAISAHSPAAIESKRGDDVDRAHHLSDAWGSPVDESRTLFHLLAHAERATMPRIRVDIGDRDFLLDEARMLRAHLVDCGIDHSYVERPGAHDWNYWERQIGETLRFMMTAYGSTQSRDASK